MSKSPPLVGGVIYTSRGRRVKQTKEGAQYRIGMAEKKLKNGLSAKIKLFSDAASLLLTKTDPTDCIQNLSSTYDVIQEAYTDLQNEEKHQKYTDDVMACLAEIKSMVEFMQATYKQKQESAHSGVKNGENGIEFAWGIIR